MVGHNKAVSTSHRPQHLFFGGQVLFERRVGFDSITPFKAWQHLAASLGFPVGHLKFQRRSFDDGDGVANLNVTERSAIVVNPQSLTDSGPKCRSHLE
jgi:hypothetical protein